MQNFRAKPDTTMRGVPDAELADLAATIAVARLVLGPSARIQAPPNLIGDQYGLILRRGHRRLGRGVAAHPGPRQPRAALAADRGAGPPHGSDAGSRSPSGSPSTPAYLREPWLDPRVSAHVAALADPVTGLARRGAIPVGLPWQEPDGGWGESSGRTDLHVTIDTTGRTTDRRDDFAEVYGDWDRGAPPDRRRRRAARSAAPERLRPEVAAALRAAEPIPPRSPTRRHWPCSTPTARSSTPLPRWPTPCAAT